jgi:hypothetical protein
MTPQTTYYTSADWINKKPVPIGPWKSTAAARSGKSSRVASAGTKKAQALLKRLADLGVK